MARPESQGLTYFSLDVNFDDKIQALEAEFEIIGYAVILKLWQRIYRDDGYYMEWSNLNHVIFSKSIGVEKEKTQEVLDRALSYGIFNEGLYEKYKIITSQGIQKRYLQGIRRRKEIILVSNYLLLSPESIQKIAPAVRFVYIPHTAVNIASTISKQINDNDMLTDDVHMQTSSKHDDTFNLDKDNMCLHDEDISIPNVNTNGITISENVDVTKANFDKVKVKVIDKEEKEKINKKEKESSPVGEGLEAVNFIDSIIFRFQNEFYKSRGREYHLNNIGKDRMAASKLLGWYKTNNPGQSSAEVLDGLQLFFAEAMNVQTKWHYERMSLSHLNSELNIIEGLIQQSTVKETEVYDESDWGI